MVDVLVGAVALMLVCEGLLPFLSPTTWREVFSKAMRMSDLHLPKTVERTIGIDYDLLDYNIGHVFSIGPKDVAVKIGDQVLNWGESSLLALNSLNTINPPDARRLNTPGLDLKEAFRPIGMITPG